MSRTPLAMKFWRRIDENRRLRGVRRVSPSTLGSLGGATTKDVLLALWELVDEGLLEVRFRVTCPNNDTWDDEVAPPIDGRFRCPRCYETFDASSDMEVGVHFKIVEGAGDVGSDVEANPGGIAEPAPPSASAGTQPDTWEVTLEFMADIAKSAADAAIAAEAAAASAAELRGKEQPTGLKRFLATDTWFNLPTLVAAVFTLVAFFERDWLVVFLGKCWSVLVQMM